ncbi:hypothetical protein AOLI_G00301290 [Acnodon oligacanthus]
MKRLLALAVLCFSCLALSQVFGEELGPKDDLDYWTNGNQIQDEWLQSDPFREILRKDDEETRPQSVHRPNGKRSSAANAQITRKRHKINSFVGLMGKRSQEETSEMLYINKAGDESAEDEFTSERKRVIELACPLDWTPGQTELPYRSD